MLRLAKQILLSLLLLSFCGVGQKAFAQNDLSLGQYQELSSYYNPSTIAKGKELRLRLAHNRQLEGVQDASKSFLLMADMPFELLGHVEYAGFRLQTHSFGLFKDNELSALMATSFQLHKDLRLRVGLGFSLISSIFEGDKVFIPAGGEGMSKTDEAIPTTEVSGRGFDAQFGLGLQYKALEVGLGVRKLFAIPILLGVNYQREASRSYNFYLGYNFPIKNTLITWKPSAFASLNEHLFYRVDTRMDFSYNKRFHFGAMYRYSNGSTCGLSLGISFGKAKLLYQFEYPMTELGRGTFGTHEAVLTYSVPLDLGKNKKGIYKSIRLL